MSVSSRRLWGSARHLLTLLVQFPDALPKSLLRESVRGRLPDALLDRTDKTYFNDFALRTADYDGLRREQQEFAHLLFGDLSVRRLDALVSGLGEVRDRLRAATEGQ